MYTNIIKVKWIMKKTIQKLLTIKFAYFNWLVGSYMSPVVFVVELANCLPRVRFSELLFIY